MGLFSWLFGKQKPKLRDPVSLKHVMIDGKPGVLFPGVSDFESLLQLAETMDSAEQQGPKRPLLYMFQHVALREAAFENHPELIRELAGERSPLPLLHFRSKAQLRCEDARLLDEDYLYDDEAMDAEMRMFQAVAIHQRKRAGFTAHVVAMPPPEFSPEAYFVAIVHKDDEAHEYMEESPSTRYFTLEKTDIADSPLLCEWRRDGSRENYGEGPPPELEAFAAAVLERVLAT